MPGTDYDFFFHARNDLFVPAPITIIFLLFSTINFFYFFRTIIFSTLTTIIYSSTDYSYFFIFSMIIFLFFSALATPIFFSDARNFPVPFSRERKLHLQNSKNSENAKGFEPKTP
jgi:hypothetical protein